MPVSSPHAPEQTAIHGPQSTGSADDRTANALSKGVSTPLDERPPLLWTGAIQL
jgi:hypothetical protein